MTLFSFPQSAAPPSASDRGVESPQGTSVASILVRYSVATDSSRVGNDGWARVRYTSCASSPLFSSNRELRWRLKFWRALRAWSALLSSPHQACKQAASIFAIGFCPSLSAVFAHEHHSNSEAFPCQERVFPKTEKEFPRLICVRQ